jgi:hypothetical protein
VLMQCGVACQCRRDRRMLACDAGRRKTWIAGRRSYRYRSLHGSPGSRQEW